MNTLLTARPGVLPCLPAALRVAEASRARGPALDQDGAFPDEEIAALHRAGLLAAPLEEEAGGSGLGVGEAGAAMLAQVLMAIGAGSLPLGRVYEGHVNALRLIGRHGRSAPRQIMARDALEGRLFGVWNTDDRQDPLRLETSGGTMVLRGRKILASGAGWVERPVVTVSTPEGPLMLAPRLARGERADIGIWQAQGMRASATGAVDFSGIVVGPEDIIGAPGDYLRQPDFSSGHWRCLAVQAGGMAELLSLLRQHLVQAGRDGDPHQRARVGACAIALETARLWVGRAAQLAAEPAEEDGADAVAYVNLARGAVEGGAALVLEKVQRSVGLAGFMRPSPLERVMRDLSTYLRQPAPDYAMDCGAAHVLARPAW